MLKTNQFSRTLVQTHKLYQNKKTYISDNVNTNITLILAPYLVSKHKPTINNINNFKIPHYCNLPTGYQFYLSFGMLSIM